jgi:hypothetical protein
MEEVEVRVREEVQADRLLRAIVLVLRAMAMLVQMQEEMALKEGAEAVRAAQEIRLLVMREE